MLKGGIKAGDRIGDIVFVTPEQGGRSAFVSIRFTPILARVLLDEHRADAILRPLSFQRRQFGRGRSLWTVHRRGREGVALVVAFFEE